jgi:hypothetical protein
MYTAVTTDAKTGKTTVREMDAKELAAITPTAESFAAEARATRNTLLAASDWTQVADAPVDQVAWATYRQALRDITTQAGFPEQINWPEAP